MEFKVRKGLETPLKIHGMLSNYFYIYGVLGGVLGLAVFVSGSDLLSGKTSGVSFGVTVIVSAAIFFGSKIYFTSKSNTTKLIFDKKNICISNRDLLKFIK